MPDFPQLPEFPPNFNFFPSFQGPGLHKREKEWIEDNLVPEFLDTNWEASTPQRIGLAVQSYLNEYFGPEYGGFDITSPDDVKDLKRIVGILDSQGFGLRANFSLIGSSEPGGPYDDTIKRVD